MKKIIPWIELLLTKDLGKKTAYNLVSKFGDPSNFEHCKQKIKKELSKEAYANLFGKILRPLPYDVDSLEKILKKEDIRVVTLLDDEYPELLKHQQLPPLILFVKGKINFKNTIAVVGTRKISEYGKRMSKKICTDLAENGFVIISGLAYGTDTIAHTAAVCSNMPTIAVLGTCVDNIYPTSNVGLAKNILKKGGGIISENLPGTTPSAWVFPVRNRIISGLSKGVVVIEGSLTSGALITEKYARDQNRETFALMGDADRPQAKGPISMIKSGRAKPITCAEDILEEYGFSVKKSLSSEKRANLTGNLKKIYSLVFESETICFDELMIKASLDFGTLSSILMELELLGYLTKLPGGSYTRN